MDLVVYFFKPFIDTPEIPRASQSLPKLPRASHSPPNLSGAPQTSPEHPRASQSFLEIPKAFHSPPKASQSFLEVRRALHTSESIVFLNKTHGLYENYKFYLVNVGFSLKTIDFAEAVQTFMQKPKLLLGTSQ